MMISLGIFVPGGYKSMALITPNLLLISKGLLSHTVGGLCNIDKILRGMFGENKT